jgi:cytochrome c-type biogenesis protein CcmH/NrfG
MNSNGGKHEPGDPENAVRMLELELMRQRATRQQASAPYRGLRAASFVFLFIVVLAALLAFYYVFHSGGLEAVRARNSPQPSPSATAISSAP